MTQCLSPQLLFSMQTLWCNVNLMEEMARSIPFNAILSVLWCGICFWYVVPKNQHRKFSFERSQ